MIETPRREAPTAPQPALVPRGIHLLRRITLRNFVIATSILQLVLCAVLVIAAWDYYPHEVSRLKLEIGTKAYSDFHIRPGEIAFWDERLVYATWDGDKHIVVMDTKDGNILAKIPADMIWPTPGPIVHSLNGHLYLMYFDQTKGWCMADVYGKEVEVKPILPGAGYSLINDTWHPLPSRDPYITWRLADFQIRYDGELEGLASVFVVDPDNVATDPEGLEYADFWFETSGKEISYSLIGKNSGLMAFALLPSVKQFPSGLVMEDWDSLILQEIARDKLGRISKGAEKRIAPKMKSGETTQVGERIDSFAVAQAPDTSKLYLLINTYQMKSDVQPFMDPSENQVWKCLTVDRASFKIEETKGLDRKADRFRLYSDERNEDWIAGWTVQLGCDWIEGTGLLMGYNEAHDKLKVAGIGARFQNDKNTQAFGPCGIAHKSPGEVYLAYLRRFGPSEDNLQTELRIYRLKLP